MIFSQPFQKSWRERENQLCWWFNIDWDGDCCPVQHYICLVTARRNTLAEEKQLGFVLMLHFAPNICNRTVLKSYELYGYLQQWLAPTDLASF